MKIHLIVTQLEPAGAQKVAIDLANGLGERGHQVTVIFFFEKIPVTYALHSNVSIHILLSSGEFWKKLFWTLPALQRYWRKNRPDVALAFTHYANVYTALAGRWTNIPVIISHHNEWTTYNKAVQILDQYLQRNDWYAGIVSVSETTKKSFEPHYKSHPLDVVIYNSFESNRQPNQEELSSGGALKILNVGRLMPQKNQSFLISSLDPDMNVELLIVGEGPEKSRLEKLIEEKGLESKVHLLGKKSHAEILALLDQTDVFAMPSLFEGMSIALLEAIVSGVYTTVSDVPSQREAVSLENEIYGTVLPIDSTASWNEFFRSKSLEKPKKLWGSEIHFKMVRRYSRTEFIEKYEQVLKVALK